MNQREVHARISQLHRELAEAHAELAGEGLTVRPRLVPTRERAKPSKPPTDLQRAKAQRILKAAGDIR